MILNEAAYTYFDLKSLLAKQDDQQNTAQQAGAENTDTKNTNAANAELNDYSTLPTDRKAAATHKAWGTRLLSIKADNKKRSGDAKLSDKEIESKFFENYFKNVWGQQIGERLLKIELISADIKVLGFDLATNPVLAFISQDYVVDTLLNTGLLNYNTFKAIHNAIANKLVAKQEFTTVNNYNIIYLKSFYNRMPADMEGYLKAQKNVLAPNASSYTVEQQLKNRVSFLKLPNNNGTDATSRAEYQLANGNDPKTCPHMRSQNAVLLDIETVYKLTGTTNEIKKQVASSAQIEELTKNLKEDIVKQYAFFDHMLRISKGDVAKAIQNFLANPEFGSVAAKAATAAYLELKKVLDTTDFTATDINTLINALSDKDKSKS